MRVNIDLGECSPQPFLAPVPDSISFGLGMGAVGWHHREGSVFRVVPPISLIDKGEVAAASVPETSPGPYWRFPHAQFLFDEPHSTDHARTSLAGP
jgi:hypothetical protein